MDPKRIDLVYHVLDLQLLDVNGRRCGKVDDIEFDGEPMRATALLVGSGVYPDRMPGRWLSRFMRHFTGAETLGRNVIRVPWEDIQSIGATVILKRPADELDLGRGDTELAPVMGRLLIVPERKP